MHVIDLSHTIETDMAVYPGDQAPELRHTHTVKQNGFLQTTLSLGTHTGTHVDVGAHLFEDAPTLDWLGPDNFTGWGAMVDLTDLDTPFIDQPHLAALASVESLDFVLLRTGHDQYWGTDDYYGGQFPALSETACRFLGGLELKGIGLDTPSPDPVGSHDLRAHSTLMNHGLVIVENLTNLGDLPNEGFVFSCLPLKLKNGEASPVRAVGMTF